MAITRICKVYIYSCEKLLFKHVLQYISTFELYVTMYYWFIELVFCDSKQHSNDT